MNNNEYIHIAQNK